MIKVENLTVSSLGETNYQNNMTYNITDLGDFTNTIAMRIGDYNDNDIAGMHIYESFVTFEGVLNQSSQFNAALGYQLLPVLPTDLKHIPTSVPNALESSPISLANNYPNPFNSTTTIKYTIAEAGFVSLKVTNILGNEIATLVNDFKGAGTYSVVFSADDHSESLGSGMYYYSLLVNNHSATRKMTLVK